MENRRPTSNPSHDDMCSQPKCLDTLTSGIKSCAAVWLFQYQCSICSYISATGLSPFCSVHSRTSRRACITNERRTRARIVERKTRRTLNGCSLFTKVSQPHASDAHQPVVSLSLPGVLERRATLSDMYLSVA